MRRELFAPSAARQRTAKSWLTEAALRMLMNNLDPDVAERPEDLVVYGGIGKAARDWPCFHAIVRELRRLRRRPNAAGAVGQAGGRLPHARRRPPRPHRQLQPGRRTGPIGSISTSSNGLA